jgi:hypothetical protein
MPHILILVVLWILFHIHFFLFFYRLWSCKLSSYLLTQLTLFFLKYPIYSLPFLYSKYFTRICFVALRFVTSVNEVCIIIISLSLILLTWKIGWTSNNASKWQMGFNSAFKVLNPSFYFTDHRLTRSKILNFAHTCINVVGMELRTESEYWALLNWRIGFYKRDLECLLRGTKCIFIYNSVECRF